jgi:hypothetical protein
VKFTIETSETATPATTITRSPEATPRASQIGATSMPASERSRALSERSKRRVVRVRILIELGIGSRGRAEIPHVGGL